MSVALTETPMSRQQFFRWAQAQEIRYEFDGTQPVAMTGGTMIHAQIARNLIWSLQTRLRGGACQALGPDAGVATTGAAVRYPDAVVTCSTFAADDLLVPDPVVVFEVVSPTSGRTDRIDKVREYRSVASIRRYIVVERTSIGAVVYERAGGGDPWTAVVVTEGEPLRMPEIGIEVRLDELYEGTDLAPASGMVP